MSKPLIKDFYRAVYEVVAEIPPGKVLTYGEIAKLIGWPCHSRLVGRALRDVPSGNPLPCHRVVNSAGQTATGWPEQTALLKSEGVGFKQNGCVDLRTHLWRIDTDFPDDAIDIDAQI